MKEKNIIIINLNDRQLNRENKITVAWHKLETRYAVRTWFNGIISLSPLPWDPGGGGEVEYVPSVYPACRKGDKLGRFFGITV